MNIVICNTDLLDVVDGDVCKVNGVDSHSTCKLVTTRSWSLLEKIGLSSISINNDYTKKFTMYIQRGGILNINALGKLHVIMEQEADMVPDEIRFRHPKYKGKDFSEIKQARKVDAIKDASWYVKKIRTLFKTIVLPSIKKFAPECGDTFKLHLHYANRKLRKINLEFGGTEK